MNCTDCFNWNPDDPESDFCDEDSNIDVKAFWALKVGVTEVDVTQCPGFMSVEILVAPLPGLIKDIGGDRPQ
jgi:hypothetical protein